MDYDDYDDFDADRFADPYGRSSLHAEREDDPRCYPCPTCGEENQLTERDKRSGYQCDGCADAAEGYGPQY